MEVRPVTAEPKPVEDISLIERIFHSHRKLESFRPDEVDYFNQGKQEEETNEHPKISAEDVEIVTFEQQVSDEEPVKEVTEVLETAPVEEEQKPIVEDKSVAAIGNRPAPKGGKKKNHHRGGKKKR